MNLSKGFLLALVVVLAGLSALLVLPFAQYVLAAVLVAYVLYPLQERLEERVDRRLAAFSLVALATAGIFFPFALIAGTVAGDALAVLSSLNAETLQIAELEAYVAERTGADVNLSGMINGPGQEIGLTVLARTTSLFGTLVHAVIGFGMMLFLLYYFLKDGDEFVAWLRETTPLPEDVQDDLYREIDDVMWATLFGHVLVAVIQGLVAGLGLVATGIPNATFWTFVMIVLAVLPLIGAFMVWGPAAGYLAVAGEPILAVGLFLYGATVVAITDDYLRPIIVDRRADLNPGVIILGVLGGVYAFGVMGLFFGPVILGALKATLTVIGTHYGRLERYAHAPER